MSDTQNANAPKVTTSPTSAATADTNKWPGAFKAYSLAYETLQKNLQPALLVIGVYVLFVLLSAVIQGESPMAEGHKSGESIVGLIFLLAIPLYGLANADKRAVSLSQFMKFDANKYFMVLFTSILCSFAVALSMVALLVPVIWVLPWVYLATYAAAEKGMGPVAAIKYSKQLTYDHKGKVWGLLGVALLLVICSFVLLVLPVVGPFLAYAGIMFITLLNNAANGMLYRYLQKLNKA
jgi:hypothetical protein